MGLNPAAMFKIMQAKKKFEGNHPKFCSFLTMALSKKIEEGTIIEISVQRPGEEKITSNLKVTESDMELFREIGSMPMN